MSCTISTRDMNGAVVLDVVGRMSFSDPHLKLLLADLIEKGHRSFVINLDQVSYLDSYGLQDLVMAYNAIKAAGGRVCLSKPNHNVRKVIEITMRTVFTLFDDEDAAIQSLRT